LGLDRDILDDLTDLLAERAVGTLDGAPHTLQQVLLGATEEALRFGGARRPVLATEVQAEERRHSDFTGSAGPLIHITLRTSPPARRSEARDPGARAEMARDGLPRIYLWARTAWGGRDPGAGAEAARDALRRSLGRGEVTAPALPRLLQGPTLRGSSLGRGSYRRT
jgi:hypothetical protein